MDLEKGCSFGYAKSGLGTPSTAIGSTLSSVEPSPCSAGWSRDLSEDTSSGAISMTWRSLPPLPEFSASEQTSANLNLGESVATRNAEGRDFTIASDVGKTADTLTAAHRSSCSSSDPLIPSYRVQQSMCPAYAQIPVFTMASDNPLGQVQRLPLRIGGKARVSTGFSPVSRVEDASPCKAPSSPGNCSSECSSEDGTDCLNVCRWA